MMLVDMKTSNSDVHYAGLGDDLSPSFSRTAVTPFQDKYAPSPARTGYPNPDFDFTTSSPRLVRSPSQGYMVGQASKLASIEQLSLDNGHEQDAPFPQKDTYNPHMRKLFVKTHSHGEDVLVQDTDEISDANGISPHHKGHRRRNSHPCILLSPGPPRLPVSPSTNMPGPWHSRQEGASQDHLERSSSSGERIEGAAEHMQGAASGGQPRPSEGAGGERALPVNKKMQLRKVLSMPASRGALEVSKISPELLSPGGKGLPKPPPGRPPQDEGGPRRPGAGLGAAAPEPPVASTSGASVMPTSIESSISSPTPTLGQLLVASPPSKQKPEGQSMARARTGMRALENLEAEKFARLVQFFDLVNAHEWREVSSLLEKHCDLMDGLHPTTGKTVVHTACDRDDEDAIAFLCNLPYDSLNYLDRDGVPPLVYATKLNNYKMVKKLISTGADINGTDSKGNTALHVACSGDMSRLVKVLLVTGADQYCTNLAGKLPSDLTSDEPIKQLIAQHSSRQPLDPSVSHPFPSQHGHDRGHGHGRSGGGSLSHSHSRSHSMGSTPLETSEPSSTGSQDSRRSVSPGYGLEHVLGPGSPMDLHLAPGSPVDPSMSFKSDESVEEEQDRDASLFATAIMLGSSGAYEGDPETMGLYQQARQSWRDDEGGGHAGSGGGHDFGAGGMHEYEEEELDHQHHQHHQQQLHHQHLGHGEQHLDYGDDGRGEGGWDGREIMHGGGGGGGVQEQYLPQRFVESSRGVLSPQTPRSSGGGGAAVGLRDGRSMRAGGGGDDAEADTWVGYGSNQGAGGGVGGKQRIVRRPSSSDSESEHNLDYGGMLDSQQHVQQPLPLAHVQVGGTEKKFSPTPPGALPRKTPPSSPEEDTRRSDRKQVSRTVMVRRGGDERLSVRPHPLPSPPSRTSPSRTNPSSPEEDPFRSHAESVGYGRRGGGGGGGGGGDASTSSDAYGGSDGGSGKERRRSFEYSLDGPPGSSSGSSRKMPPRPEYFYPESSSSGGGGGGSSRRDEQQQQQQQSYSGEGNSFKMQPEPPRLKPASGQIGCVGAIVGRLDRQQQPQQPQQQHQGGYGRLGLERQPSLDYWANLDSQEFHHHLDGSLSYELAPLDHMGGGGGGRTVYAVPGGQQHVQYLDDMQYVAEVGDREHQGMELALQGGANDGPVYLESSWGGGGGEMRPPLSPRHLYTSGGGSRGGGDRESSWAQQPMSPAGGLLSRPPRAPLTARPSPSRSPTKLYMDPSLGGPPELDIDAPAPPGSSLGGGGGGYSSDLGRGKPSPPQYSQGPPADSLSQRQQGLAKDRNLKLVPVAGGPYSGGSKTRKVQFLIPSSGPGPGGGGGGGGGSGGSGSGGGYGSTSSSLSPPSPPGPPAPAPPAKLQPPSEKDLANIRPDWVAAATAGGCVACEQEDCNGSCVPGGGPGGGSSGGGGGGGGGGALPAKSAAADEAAPAPNKEKLFENSETKTTGSLQWTRGELLGEGAYGKVFAGLNQQTGQLMAVKQLKLTEGDEKSLHMAALEREIALYRTMRHKHIVGYIDMERDEVSGSLYVFLEFVSGGSIHSMLERFGKFSETIVRVYARQLLLGLTYLHSKHIIHRDIKGGNVLVDQTGIIKLADFGASKAFHDKGTLTDGCKSIRGSVFWMAPEVIKGNGYGRRADIWSVGCTVIEMLTAAHPWPGMDNTWTAIFHIAQATSGPPIPADVSPEGRDFLERCFHLNPNERPTAEELLKHPFVNVPDTARRDNFDD